MNGGKEKHGWLVDGAEIGAPSPAASEVPAVTVEARTRWQRAALLVSAVMLLAAPALLFIGALIVCTAGECRPGNFDLAGMSFAAQWHGPLSDAFFRGVTWGGSILVLGPLAVVHAAIMWHRLRCAGALFLPTALAGASLMAYATKSAVARERPDVAPLIEMPVDASFPSAHTLQIGAFAMAWLLAPTRRGQYPGAVEIAVAVILVMLVSWSRLHLQVHYPSDILFALVAAVIWVVALRQSPIWSAKP